MSDLYQELRDRVTTVETTLGKSTADGVRGEISEVKKNVETIFDRLRAFELRLYGVTGGALVAVWLLERVWK